MKLVTFAWGSAYRARARICAASAKERGYDLEVIEYPGEPSSPQEALRLKPRLLLEALGKGEPVLLLDADSEVRGPLTLIEDANTQGWDFALYVTDLGEMWNGTLLVCPTERARRTLRVWALLLGADDWGTLDHVELEKAIRAVGARVLALPREYHWVERWHRETGAGNLPVILHAAMGHL